MFKQWFKQFLALCICAIMILSPIMPVQAKNYKANDDDEDTGSTYYIIEGKDVDKLFDFGLYDVDDLLSWIMNFKTYTVIKEYEDDNGETIYKMYFNTPNLQSLVKNRVINIINDGYTDDTYDVNDTEKLVKVGKNATSENVITKYGFNIPSYIYMGEYPKETMTIAGIIPTTWYGKVWTSVKSIFGASFIDAPDSDNFNTITYMNHTYNDKNEYIVRFFKKYYLTYFDRKIANNNCNNGDSYFTSPEDLLDKTVTKEDNDKAESYNKAHKDEYEKISVKVDAWNTYKSSGASGLISAMPKINGKDTEEFLASMPKYQKAFIDWANKHKAYVYLCIVNSGGKPKNYGLTDINSSMPTDTKKLIKIIKLLNKPDINSSIKVKITYKYDDDNDANTPEVEKSEIVSLQEAIDNNHLNDIVYITDKNDTAGNNCPLDDKNSFDSTASFNSYKFEKEDFVSTDEQIIYDTYNENQTTIDKYKAFTELLENGKKPDSKNSMAEILYRQCMITNEGKDGECWSKKYGDGKTTITVANVYAYSGLYKISQKYSDKQTELSNVDVNKILTTLQSYCGPYYTEVLGNMMKLMCATAAYEGNTDLLTEISKDDPRVMPYDTFSLLSTDKENYACTDPRTEIYKEHVIGGLVSNFTLNYGFMIFVKPQKTIINIGGRITELSIFLQQLINFDILDGYGLSPVNMWNNDYVLLIMGILALVFIIKTVSAVIKMGNNNANVSRIIISFLLLVLELGFLTAIAASPTRVWNSIKTIDRALMNLGEMSTVYSNTDLTYLYGDATDQEVTYYMPYLDLWSKFNTGYGILENEQKIDTNRDIAELKDIKYPKIGNNNIQHYSVLLMDSFSYYGDSTSVTTSVTENGKIYNGSIINNNAYRVVDHFMSPRVAINKIDDETINLNITENENYNNEFQSGVVDLIVKLLNCILMCLLSLIKCMTFLWQWFVFYIFIFKVILSKTAENKTWTDILIETFSPTLCIIFIGLYAGIIMTMSMEAEGILGICLEIFLFWLTFMIIRWWKNVKHGQLFPHTLEWLYILTNFSHYSRSRRSDELATRAQQLSRNTGDDMSDSESKNFSEQTNHFFNEDGTFKDKYKDPIYNEQLQGWYEFSINSQRCGHVLTENERRAIQTFESDERFTEFVNSHKNTKGDD